MACISSEEHIKYKLHLTLSPAWMSLSMPRGPKVVRTASATAWQALMFDTSYPRPWLVSVPSFNKIIYGCIWTLGLIMASGDGVKSFSAFVVRP